MQQEEFFLQEGIRHGLRAVAMRYFASMVVGTKCTHLQKKQYDELSHWGSLTIPDTNHEQAMGRYRLVHQVDK